MSGTPYNPSRDEPAETMQFACMWELLRRNPEFQVDARIWLQSWNECEGLLAKWAIMTEEKRLEKEGQENHRRRIELRDQLFAMKYGTLPFEEPPQGEAGNPSKFEKWDLARIRDSRAKRGWNRANFVVCALTWLLPTITKQRALTVSSVRNRLGHGSRPEEFRPELSLEQHAANQPFGSLRLDMALAFQIGEQGRDLSNEVFRRYPLR